MQYYRLTETSDRDAVKREIKRWWQDIVHFPEVSEIEVNVTLVRGETPRRELKWSPTESPLSLRAFCDQNLRAPEGALAVTVGYALTGKNRSIDLLKELTSLITSLLESGFVVASGSQVRVKGEITDHQFWAKLSWNEAGNLEHSGYRPPTLKSSTEDGFRRVGGWGRSAGW